MRTRLLIPPLLCVALAVAGSGPAQAAPLGDSPAGTYLVQLAGDPLATYAGGVQGIPATRASSGRLDVESGPAQAYRDQLRQQRQAVLRKAGLAEKRVLAEYQTVYNGFAVRLTDRESARLRTTAGVVRVVRSVPRKAAATPPETLGLSGEAGAWQQHFGGSGTAGAGTIIGVIDSGIWPENETFAPLPEPRPDQAVIDAKWRGDDCRQQTGPDPVPCTNKIIGARTFSAGFPDGLPPQEYATARDRNGHGSHAASVAAGNHDVAVTTAAGKSLGLISGMAPAARIAVYKAVWHRQDWLAMGETVDLVAAIEQAVLDGVDVINYSVSNGGGTALTAEDVAMFNAAAAGVFVAAAAGNDGRPGSVGNTMPWVTTTSATDRNTTKVDTRSSIGPVAINGANLGKPDLAGPGDGIVGAWSPVAYNNEKWLTYGGTSMANAHVAGLAALIRQKHPDWSPAAVRSALMTTARQTAPSGEPITFGTQGPANALHFGAGVPRADQAVNPGLVFDSTPAQWLQYVCGIGLGAQFDTFATGRSAEACAAGEKLDPSDLNYPSIAIGALGESRTVTRTVTNVSAADSVYTAAVQAPSGTTVTVTPNRLTLAPGASATFTVRIERAGPSEGDFTHGALSWTDSAGHVVRSPVTVGTSAS
ncbi:S8 family serine peptidase [Actinoplanes sp. NPDC051859]|uniref:S8 family serine peptidase n=1 Tax=Actinoplanes sp. NPDC051859 TaxID=3363909 RepID=UPI003789BAD8